MESSPINPLDPKKLGDWVLDGFDPGPASPLKLLPSANSWGVPPENGIGKLVSGLGENPGLDWVRNGISGP